MKLNVARHRWWLGLNGLSGLVFLFLSSSQWIEPELKDDPGASGGAPFVFALLVLWSVVPIMVLNLAWLAFSARKAFRDRDWTPPITFAAIAAAWVALVMFSASKV
jgi:hypothetical protein